MRDDVRVRPARPADAPALERIYQAVRAEIAAAPTAGFAADTTDEALLVAEVGGRVAGFVAVYAPDAFVHHLYVSAEERGRGTGAALLSAATALLGGPAWLKVDAVNEPARAFYRGRGWVEEEPADGVVVVRAPPG